MAVVQCELAGEVKAYDDKPPLRYYVTMYDTESGERVWDIGKTMTYRQYPDQVPYRRLL